MLPKQSSTSYTNQKDKISSPLCFHMCVQVSIFDLKQLLTIWFNSLCLYSEHLEINCQIKIKAYIDLEVQLCPNLNLNSYYSYSYY